MLASSPVSYQKERTNKPATAHLHLDHRNNKNRSVCKRTDEQPVRTYRDLVRTDACLQKTDITPQQLAQGVIEYAKLNPAAYVSHLTANDPGLTFPSVTGGLGPYFEFLCPDLFNKAAYDRDDAIVAKYPIDPQDGR